MRISNLLEEHSVTSHCVEPSSALQNHHVKKVPSSKNFMIMVVLFMSVMTIMIMMMNINGALQKMVTTWRMKVTLIMISGFHTSGSWNLFSVSLLIERTSMWLSGGDFYPLLSVSGLLFFRRTPGKQTSKIAWSFGWFLCALGKVIQLHLGRTVNEDVWGRGCASAYVFGTLSIHTLSKGRVLMSPKTWIGYFGPLSFLRALPVRSKVRTKTNQTNNRSSKKKSCTILIIAKRNWIVLPAAICFPLDKKKEGDSATLTWGHWIDFPCGISSLDSLTMRRCTQPRTGAAAKQRLAIRQATKNLENSLQKNGFNICQKKKLSIIWREGGPGQTRSNYDPNAVEHLDEGFSKL